ncbi:MAG: hypothetical protein AAFY17_15175, partial [Cyanobacteria bacterium J06642_11]
MTNTKFQLPLALLSGLTVGFGSKSRSALAHSGHSHSAFPESKSTNLEKVSQPSDETRNDVTETLESQPNLTEPITASEEMPISAEGSVPAVST